jgi:hypothetical protein
MEPSTGPSSRPGQHATMLGAWRTTALAVNELLAHVVLLAVFILSIWLIQQLIHMLWTETPQVFVGTKWQRSFDTIIDAAHLGLFSCFSIMAIGKFTKVYRGS